MAWIERQLFISLLWVSAGVALFADVASADGREVVALAILMAIAGWLHGICGVQKWTIDKVPPGPYVVATLGLVALFAAAVFVDVSYLFLLFGVFSFTFGYSSDVRLAAGISAVITALWIAAWLHHDLPRGAIATPIFVWGIANAINVLSTRISVQNTERGELIDRLNATRDQLAIAERERGVLEERSRLAREIHDTLAQGFTSVVLLSEAMHGQIESLPREQIGDSLLLLSSTARENLAEARQLIAAEPPTALENGSLSEALNTLADEVRRRTNAEVELHGDANIALGGSEEVVMFRVAQEASNNIIKYAKASRVEFALSLENDIAELSVRDDGIGFSQTSAAQDERGQPNDLRGGSGLIFMAERVEELNGQLEVTSAVGVGTTVRAQIPVGGSQ